MSPRPTKPLSQLKRTCITGAVTVGAIALTLIATGPAQAGQTPAAPHSAHDRAHSQQVDHAASIRVPANTDERISKAHQKPPSAADVLKLATSQVGTTEDADGGTKYDQWFMSSPFARRGVRRDGGSVGDYANAEWCDMFVSWVGNTLGVKGFGGDAFVPAHAKWFQAQGRWGDTPKPGAVRQHRQCHQDPDP